MASENPLQSEPWSHQNAYAALQAKAKHVAGLENARALIRQSRQIRYLRYVQLAHQQRTEAHAEEEHADAATETELVSTPQAEETNLARVA